jgi:diguanylate cyclase (GGDEF)-like protein
MQWEFSMPPEPSEKDDEDRARLTPAARPPPRHEPVDLSRGALPKVFEKQVTPLRLFLTSIVAVFMSQFFIYLALRLTGIRGIRSPSYTEALLMGISLVVLILPVLYAGLYRPMVKHIARQLQLENALRELATVDELTDILNRRGFRAVAEDYLRLARRMKTGLCCLFIDLNGFKRINDTLGHNVGDEALIETARLLKSTFRESDLIARVGGDEFVVLAVEIGFHNTDRMIERLQEKLSAANAKAGRKYQISFCIGVARSEPGQECPIAALVARADRAMYEQKQALKGAEAPRA